VPRRVGWLDAAYFTKKNKILFFSGFLNIIIDFLSASVDITSAFHYISPCQQMQSSLVD